MALTTSALASAQGHSGGLLIEKASDDSDDSTGGSAGPERYTPRARDTTMAPQLLPG